MGTLTGWLFVEGCGGNQGREGIAVQCHRAVLKEVESIFVGGHRHPAYGGLLEQPAGDLDVVLQFGMAFGASLGSLDPHVVAAERVGAKLRLGDVEGRLEAFGRASCKARQILVRHALTEAIEWQSNNHHHRCRVAVTRGERDLNAGDPLLFFLTRCGLGCFLLNSGKTLLDIGGFPIRRDTVAEAEIVGMDSGRRWCLRQQGRAAKDECGYERSGIHFAASLPR